VLGERKSGVENGGGRGREEEKENAPLR